MQDTQNVKLTKHNRDPLTLTSCSLLMEALEFSLNYIILTCNVFCIGVHRTYSKKEKQQQHKLLIRKSTKQV